MTARADLDYMMCFEGDPPHQRWGCLPPAEFRREFLSRNAGLLTSGQQERIRGTRLLLVGCGLGSQVAVLSSRTGFEHFTLYDGDTVELHNLNRQAFEIADLGKNKATVTHRNMLRVNPHLQVTSHPRFLRQPAEIAEVVPNHDVIINMADPDEAMYAINDIGQKQGSLVLFPLNFGYGAYVLAFLRNAPTIAELVGGKIQGVELYQRLLEKSMPHHPELSAPKTLDILKIYGQLLARGETIGPQLGISAYMTAVLTVKTMIRWILGEQIPLAPAPIMFEPGK